MPNAYEITAIDGIGVEELLQDAVDEVDLITLQEEIDEHVVSLGQRKFDSFDSD